MKNPVEQYIVNCAFDASQDGALIQERLQLIRDTAKSIFPPETSETIYHGVPTFFLNGTDILCYGAYKKHITLYIGYDLVDVIKKQYPEYQYSKAAVMIPYDKEMPVEVIETICRAIIM